MYQTLNVQPLLGSIAAALGEGWAVQALRTCDNEQMMDRGYIACGAVRLFLCPVWNKSARLAISATLPASLAGVWPAPHLPEITVDANKSAAVIAKDITRRVLPETLEMIAFCERKQAAQDQRDNTKRRGLNTLNTAAGALGTIRASRPNGSNAGEVLELGRGQSGAFYGSAEVTAWTGTDGTDTATVDVKLNSLTVSQAAALLERLHGVMLAAPAKN